MRKDSIQNEFGKIYFSGYRGLFKRQRSATLFRALADDTLLALSNKTPPHRVGPNSYRQVNFDNVQLFPAQFMGIGYASLCGSQNITLSTSRAAEHYLWSRYAPIDTNRSIQVSDTGWYVGIAFSSDSAFVDSIYVGRGSVARSHQVKYCSPPITLQASFAGIPGYSWSTGQNAHRIEVHQPGTYWCAAQVSTDCIVSDSFTVSAHDIPEITLPTDTSFCRGTSISVDATHAAYKQYQWSSGEDTAFITITDAGIYKLVATTHNDCMYEKTLTAKVWELPEVRLPADTAFCPGDRHQLQLDAGNWKSYAWYPGGQTGQSITVKDAGRYKITITDNNNCKGTDEINIREECPEEVYIPNAFTPDANGTNDWFEPRGRYIQSYHMQITNRWGDEVFNGTHAWDGNIQERPAQSGVYAYKITVVTENKEHKITGTLTLMR
jgi:gliding motility-associated-like protein